MSCCSQEESRRRYGTSFLLAPCLVAPLLCLFLQAISYINKYICLLFRTILEGFVIYDSESRKNRLVVSFVNIFSAYSEPPIPYDSSPPPHFIYLLVCACMSVSFPHHIHIICILFIYIYRCMYTHTYIYTDKFFVNR